MVNQHAADLTKEREKAIPLPEKNAGYVNPLNQSLKIFFKNARTVSIKNPSQALFFLKTVRNQQKAARVRARLAKQGIHIPPMLIFSITNRCNLHCQGCYHQALRDITKAELSEEKLHQVIAEAGDLGISFIVLAGGEPLVRPDILKITREFPEIIFLMFTNGLLITDEMITHFKSQKNIVPIFSLEGYEQDTDGRRGSGVYQRLQRVIEKIKKQDVFFGVSLTVTRTNFKTLTDPDFVDSLTKLGCKLLLFAEYTPVKAGTNEWVITTEQRNKLSASMNAFRSQYSALFISVPGDERDFGGCLSAGRGFIHISAEGDVEPCPFAPYSDSSVREQSLKEALQSKLLRTIRENDDLGGEADGSCALFARREWAQSLLAKENK